MTAEGQKHQRVISVGHDPLVEQNQNLYVLVSQGLYESSKEKNEMKAFSFHFIQPEATNLVRLLFLLLVAAIVFDLLPEKFRKNP